MKKDPHNKNLRIRLTEEEDRAIVVLARFLGEGTRSRIIRKMIREAIGQGPDLLKDDLNSFREAVRQLAAVGRNINQIAHALNAGRAPDFPLDSRLLRDVEDRVTTLKRELVGIVMRTRHRWVHRD